MVSEMFGMEVSPTGNRQIAIYPKHIWKLVAKNNQEFKVARDALSRRPGIGTMTFHNPIRARHKMHKLTNVNIVARIRSEYKISMERREELIGHILMAAVTNGMLKGLRQRCINMKASTIQEEQNNMEIEL